MRLLLFFVCFSVFFTTFAQPFGGHPLSQRWFEVRRPGVSVIFPTGWDSTGKRVAALLSKIDSVSPFHLDKPVPVILQHHTTLSNGYVALAPFRSEWYMTAPVNAFELGSLNWAEQLAIHEQRHIQQYQRFNRGGAKIFRFFLGQQGQALANALTVPDWFFEGDAVYQETLLSEQGRGRMPSFYNGYRAIREAGKNYSYQKLRNGSFKDYVPNHYQLGYLLTQYGYETYGKDFWTTVTNDAAAIKGVFYPFQKALRKSSGIDFKQFRRNALALNQELGGSNKIAEVMESQPVINEENPVYTEQGDLIYLRSSYSDLPAFYIRGKEGKEKKIRVRDRSMDGWFSYSSGKLIYASYQPDLRWGWRDYGTLKLLDIHTGHQQTISRQTKYFTPSLSSTGDSIITLLQNEKGYTILQLLNSRGELLKEIPNDSGYLYSFPVFSGKDIISATRNRKGEMTLHRIDLETGVHYVLFRWTNHIIGYPRPRGDSIYFTMAVQGRDQTMLFHEGKLGALEPVFESGVLTGKYQPAVYGAEYTVMKFGAFGYKLQTNKIPAVSLLNADELLNQPMFRLTTGIYKNAPESFLEGGDDMGEIRPYSNLRGLCNFHSWTPWYEEPEFSFTAHSQNLLNNFQNNLSLKYNRNEGFTQVGFSTVFGAAFPYLKASADYTFNRKGRYRNRTIRWNELEFSGGIELPLNLSSGRQISSLNLSSSVTYNKPYYRLPEKDSLGNRSFSYLEHQLLFGIQTQQAKQQIFPSWATTIRMQSRNTINRYSSRQWLTSINIYTPGILKNNSLVLSGAIGSRDSLQGIRFSNNFPFARGFESINLYRTQKLGLSYHFPVVYPDVGFGQIVYLLRIRAAGFFDWSRAMDPEFFNKSGWFEFKSTGMEWYLDTRWWNQLPVSFGIRYAYLMDRDLGVGGNHRWQFILPVNLIPAGAAAKGPKRHLRF